MKIQISILVVLAVALMLTACTPKTPNTNRPVPEPVKGGYILNDEVQNINEHLDYQNSSLKTIYFAGGCFWGVEAYMERIYGVANTESGYANGEGENPSYEDVIKGDQEFVEAVKVTYDPERVSLETLVDYLFRVIDPTTKDQQGNDKGVQYRTGIYYEDAQDAAIVEETVKKEQAYYKQKVVTEAEPLQNYFPAEDYHQDYLIKNPNGYCHINMNVLDEEPIVPTQEDLEIVKTLGRPS